MLQCVMTEYNNMEQMFLGSASAQLEKILRGVLQQQRTQDLINGLPGNGFKAFGRQFKCTNVSYVPLGGNCSGWLVMACI